MNDPLQFETRSEFRAWLADNCTSSGGVWLLFGKTEEIRTLKAARPWRKRSVSDGSTG